MKRIVKKDIEPAVLTSWKTAHPGKVYKDFQKYSQKRELHSELLSEQFYLCCYCGADIDIDHSHIEHIAPQGQFKKRTLSYPNLLVSCNGEKMIETGEEELKYCGHHKDNVYDVKMLTPLEEDCEDRLKLLLNGKVCSTNQEDYGALKAIDILGLNNYALFKARENIIEILITAEISEWSRDKQIKYFEEEIKYLETVDKNGQLSSFSQELVSLLKFLIFSS